MLWEHKNIEINYRFGKVITENIITNTIEKKNNDVDFLSNVDYISDHISGNVPIIPGAYWISLSIHQYNNENINLKNIKFVKTCDLSNLSKVKMVSDKNKFKMVVNKNDIFCRGEFEISNSITNISQYINLKDEDKNYFRISHVSMEIFEIINQITVNLVQNSAKYHKLIILMENFMLR